MFNPSAALKPPGRPRRVAKLEEPLERSPTLDALERFLVLLYLRGYVTYHARRRRFAQVGGAARSFWEIRERLVGGDDDAPVSLGEFLAPAGRKSSGWHVDKGPYEPHLLP